MPFKFLFPIVFLLFQCTNNKYADLIIKGAIISLDSLNSRSNAMAIIGDQIVEIGSKEVISEWKGPETKVADYGNSYIYPGFIEGHGHFEGLGKSLLELNLLETTSWESIVSEVASEKPSTKGDWIIGRGWHQDKWDSLPSPQFENYPHHQGLSELTPDNPVILIHASGHSLFANKAAMDQVGITREMNDPIGGRIVRNVENEMIGVFEETAMRPFNEAYNEWQKNRSEEYLSQRRIATFEVAQKECVKNGITSFQDAGSSAEMIDFYHSQSQLGEMDIRLWVMLRETYDEMKNSVKTIPPANDYYSCTAIKSEIDGALGSYGAWLLKPYFDKPGFEGQNTTSLKELTQIADLCKQEGVQLCVHAIGDRGNRIVLDMMEAKTKGLQDHRWRIEHVQHLHPDDIPRFSELGVIASMQSVHCTSDAPFVVKRLGEKRAREGAYVWNSLLESGAIVSNGTDVPVEKIDPIANFYSAITRMPRGSDEPFFEEEKMSRIEALKAMTISAAYAAFEEDTKGSIEVGKFADFTILDQDLENVGINEVLKTKVVATYVGGELKYSIDRKN